MARLRDIFRGWGPADPPNVLTRNSLIHKTESNLERQLLPTVKHFSLTAAIEYINHVPKILGVYSVTMFVQASIPCLLKTLGKKL